jgi:anti-sigma-K factor RskA
MNDRAANHALGRAGPRRATVIWLWLPLAVAAAIVLAVNAHLIYVATMSQPPCVAHLRLGEADTRAGAFSAAQSSCAPAQAAARQGETP